MASRKLLVVSNRLPISLEKKGKKWNITPSSGGLITALSGLKNSVDFEWLGWCGAQIPQKECPKIFDEIRENFGHHPLYLSEQQIENYYDGFSNEALWPLFHYEPEKVEYREKNWHSYQEVNELFANEILARSDEDTLIWIHDYHLFLVPELIRKKRPKQRIGFFLHIPFPSSEIYKLLPGRAEVLKGILGSSVVGFHVLEYQRHFTSSVLRILGHECKQDSIRIGERNVLLSSHPIGIEPETFIKACEAPESLKMLDHYKKLYGKKKVVLGVDRLDYMKGLPQKLKSWKAFLEKNPKRARDTTLIQVALPSRGRVQEYADLKKNIDQLVGEINGLYGTPSHVPINYIAKPVEFPKLVALYQLADALLVTSTRDGMNLVSLEYIACQNKRNGSLLLSEFAGAAHSLSHAELINPWDYARTGQQISDALNLNSKEKKHRQEENFKHVLNNTSSDWARHYVNLIQDSAISNHALAKPLKDEIFNFQRSYRIAKKRTFILDYDGTLVSFKNNPTDASPPKELLNLLQNLARRPQNRVFVVSGRKKEDLMDWFDNTVPELGLSAEHGLFLKDAGQKQWIKTTKANTTWKSYFEKILKDFVDRCPGSFVEDKHCGLVWHYRQADEILGTRQANELLLHLEETSSNMPVEILRGNKVIEIRIQGLNKGLIVNKIMDERDADWVFCVGDDRTDEDMFLALGDRGWSCRVGQPASKARYYLENQSDVIELLEVFSQYN